MQAISDILCAFNPLYYISKLRRDWALHLSTSSKGHLTI